MRATVQRELKADVVIVSDGFARVVLRGRLDARAAADYWQDLEKD